MHQQFNIQQLYVLPTLYLCVFLSIYLRTNSDLCHLQHKLIGFYNRDEKCLLRGTNWVFKYISLRFVFKVLITKTTRVVWATVDVSAKFNKKKQLIFISLLSLKGRKVFFLPPCVISDVCKREDSLRTWRSGKRFTYKNSMKLAAGCTVL